MDNRLPFRVHQNFELFSLFLEQSAGLAQHGGIADDIQQGFSEVRRVGIKVWKWWATWDRAIAQAVCGGFRSCRSNRDRLQTRDVTTGQTVAGYHFLSSPPTQASVTNAQ